MDYMILKEASAKWGVTPRWINYFCSGGRIPGPVKMGMVWLIPKSASVLQKYALLSVSFVTQEEKPF